ncbi:MAG: SPASM domain-containing protein [Reyranella sp.]|nr:SPASM domain-containing protein [Reyranella sp.]
MDSLVREDVAGNSAPKLSLFTVCMGRLHHLKQTLPLNLAWNADHPSLEFVLLDYSSPDGMYEWVQAELGEYLRSGRVVYYRYDDAQFFSYSHSRNMAARLCKGEIICNVDADNLTGPGFAQYIEGQMRDKDLLVGCDVIDGAFHSIPNDLGFSGRVAVRRELFFDIGGYDEDMIAWGYEDMDLYNRLGRSGLRLAPMERQYLSAIPHEDDQRIAYTKVKDIGRSPAPNNRGTALEHETISRRNIARGELVANRGCMGVGRVRRSLDSETVPLRRLEVEARPRADLREKNNWILEREIANGIATMRGIPNILFLELTRRCNLACGMCRAGMMKDHSLDMSEAVLRRIEEDLLPTARVIDLRGWGDSLVRRDFLSIVERFAQPGVQLRVLSNGTIRKAENWQTLMRHHAWVGISVDATENALLKELRGARIEPIEQSLKQLVHWRDVYGNNPENVFITVTVSTKNLDSLQDLLTWAHKLGVKRVHMVPIYLHPTDPRTLIHREAAIPPVFDRLREMARSWGMTLQLGAAMTSNLILKDRMLDRCIHPWMYAYISYAGDVGFCDHLIGRDDLTSGNILDRPLEEIWNSEPLVTLRADHLAKRDTHPYFEHCAWCFKNRYADFEHKIRPELSSILVTDATVPSFHPTPLAPAIEPGNS